MRGIKIIRNAILITGGIAVLAFLCLGRVDRRNIGDTDAFRNTFAELALPDRHQVISGRIEAGWSRRHIVPDAPRRLAGYGFSGKFNGVHDSLYVQVIAVRAMEAEAFIISADLLMFPRELARCVEREVSLRYGTNAACYFTASHTHKGYGNWDPSPAGQIILGKYREELVTWLCERIMDALEDARADYQYTSIGFRKSEAGAWVRNRVDPTAPADGWLRAVEFIHEDGNKALLISFAAHPVNIGDAYPALSNDYAAYLISDLEDQGLAEMAVFAAGMVGSHNAPRGHERDYERARWIAGGLYEAYVAEIPSPALDTAAIGFRQVPVFLPGPQLRLAPGIRLRPWLFELLFGKPEAYIRTLRIGNVLMLGMPCDFSGEIAVLDGLDDYARERGLNLLITSFNGAYIGYITADHHYDKSRHEEVMAMNWVGPGMGRYFSAVIVALIDRHSPPLAGPGHD